MATRDGVSFRTLCRLHHVPPPLAEFEFAIGRRFRFDWAWPVSYLALEVEGGLFAGGRHVRAKGIRSDMEKYNLAACLGWIVIRCLPEDLASEATFEWIRFALQHRTNVDLVQRMGRP